MMSPNTRPEAVAISGILKPQEFPRVAAQDLVQCFRIQLRVHELGDRKWTVEQLRLRIIVRSEKETILSCYREEVFDKVPYRYHHARIEHDVGMLRSDVGHPLRVIRRRERVERDELRIGMIVGKALETPWALQLRVGD